MPFFLINEVSFDTFVSGSSGLSNMVSVGWVAGLVADDMSPAATAPTAVPKLLSQRAAGEAETTSVNDAETNDNRDGVWEVDGTFEEWRDPGDALRE